jgi:hypothetical protein
MDMERKTCEIRTWKKLHLYLDITSHHFTGASKPAAQNYFDCFLSHFRTSVSTSASAKLFWAQLSTALRENTSQHKKKIFLYEYPLH